MTAFEICREMEYWLYKCVGNSNPQIDYLEENKSFVYYENEKAKILTAYEKGRLKIEKPLPPKYVRLIGEFYEKLEKEK